jgi:hypothetical protein
MSGASSRAEQLGILLADGGSSPTAPLHIKSLRVVECPFSEISPVFRRFHYREDAFGGSAKHVFGLTNGVMVFGGAVFGETWHRDKYGTAEDGVLELKRFALLDEAPRNTESYFLGRLARILGKMGYIRLLAYSDERAGHLGTIYRAAGWNMVSAHQGSPTVSINGRTYHARSLTIDRPYAAKLRESVADGGAEMVRSPGLLRLYEKRLKEVNDAQ